MPTAEEFDEFYVSTRRELVLQTFALTGDLVASRSAVRDAYVAARHHWDKIGRTADPLNWVRPRAWSRAQRRHTARPWHRERHIDAEQTATLEALHRLKDAQRRSLVLSILTDLPIEAIAREVGLPLPNVQDHLSAAVEITTEALGCSADEIADRLEALGPAADSVKLPRPTIVRRNGLRRRRNFAVTGSVLISGLMIVAGSFVVTTPAQKADAAAQRQSAQLVSATKKQLLATGQITPLAPKQAWAMTSTTTNVEGNGLNSTCQKRRFADDNGAGTWVRKFRTANGLRRVLVQTIEISRSEADARNAYLTTLGWYAGCSTETPVRLVDAFQVTGVGDEAEVLRLQLPGTTKRSYVVGIARTGSLTTSTLLETNTKDPIPASLVAATLSTSVRNLCTSRVAGACIGDVVTTGTRPPASGETPGMLAATDLPAIAKIYQPWSGTKATTAGTNRAATTCDLSNFVKAGATNPISRDYLIPEAINLPRRFGITETIGRFKNAKAADKFVNGVTKRMSTCEDRELGSTITTAVVQKGTATKPSYAFYRLVNQYNQDRDEATYWMGVTRVGPYVAQVLLTPVRSFDVSSKTFSRLVMRARDRLFEVR